MQILKCPQGTRPASNKSKTALQLLICYWCNFGDSGADLTIFDGFILARHLAAQPLVEALWGSYAKVLPKEQYWMHMGGPNAAEKSFQVIFSL